MTPGNSIIPTQAAHDAHYGSGKPEVVTIRVGSIEIEITGGVGERSISDAKVRLIGAVTTDITNALTSLFRLSGDDDLDALVENAAREGKIVS